MEFDYILAMDRSNLIGLNAIAPGNMRAKLSLFLPDGKDVPDPYYGGPDGFRNVVDLIEKAADHWLRILQDEVDTRVGKA